MARKSRERLLAESLENESQVAWGLPILAIAEDRFWAVLRAAIRERIWGPAMIAGSMLETFVRPDRDAEYQRLKKIWSPQYEALRRRRPPRRYRTKERSMPHDAKWSPAGHSRARRRLGYALVMALLIEPASSRIWRLRYLTRIAIQEGWIFEASFAARFTRSATSLLPKTPGLRDADRELQRLLRDPEVQRVNASCFNPIRDFIAHYRVRPDFGSPFGSFEREGKARAPD